MERREFLALAATLPIWIQCKHASEVRLNHIRFIGVFGNQVEEELWFQLSQQRPLSERLLNLTSSRNRPRYAVVSEISHPELFTFIKSIESNAEYRRSCVGYFASNFRTKDVSRKENIGKQFRLVHDTFPHQRTFTDLDFEEPKLIPEWPMEWKNNNLTLEQKQIVWELFRNQCI
jgi:hypothetical protein